MRALLRFGQIGDLITAANAAKALDLPLFFALDRATFAVPALRQHGYAMQAALSRTMSAKLGIGITSTSYGELRSEVRRLGVTELLYFVQTPTAAARASAWLLNLLLPCAVRVLYDGSQWIYHAISANNLLVKERLSRLARDGLYKIGINWDGKEASKNLRSETVRHVATALRTRFPSALITVIGKGRLEAALDDTSIENLSGQTTLDEALEIIAGSDLLITCDSGPLHFAASLDVCTVAFMAARYPLAYWYPFSPCVAVVSDLLVPCRQTGCRSCNASRNVCVNGPGPLRQFDALLDDGTRAPGAALVRMDGKNTGAGARGVLPPGPITTEAIDTFRLIDSGKGV